MSAKSRAPVAAPVPMLYRVGPAKPRPWRAAACRRVQIPSHRGEDTLVPDTLIWPPEAESKTAYPLVTMSPDRAATSGNPRHGEPATDVSPLSLITHLPTTAVTLRW